MASNCHNRKLSSAGRLSTLRGNAGVLGHRSSGLLTTTQRWNERKAKTRGMSRDDLRKIKKMKIDKFDEFDEWIDGDRSMRYTPVDVDARKHLSGWAMRNTNNHNKKVLKKSCLGVFLCNKSCRSQTGEITTVRPATSDKARQKQAAKACPNSQCNGRLYHVACSGKSGYPVTHFWRVTDQVILFQCKGVHDHPRPDVVKTTTAAKQALLEYHRRHRHERPKEICKKVGVYIHKSFSRVDRVARQLREVSSTSPIKNDRSGESDPDHKLTSTSSGAHHGYSLRGLYNDYWVTPQKAADAVSGKHAAVPSMSACYYPPNHHQTSGMYSSVPIYDSHSSYSANCNSSSNVVFPPYEDSMSPTYDHGSMEYTHQHAQSSYHPSITSYFEVKPDGTTYYQPLKQSPRQATAAPACSPNQERPHHPPQPTAVDNTHYNHDYHTSTTSNATNAVAADESSQAPTLPPNKQAIKRRGAPELIPIDPKQVKTEQHRQPPKYDMASLEREEMNPIKLSEHTPGINLDLSNFADIFDFSGLVQQDEGLGLAGRPKAATLVANDTTTQASVQDRKVEDVKKEEVLENSGKEESALSNSPPPTETATAPSSPASEIDSEQQSTFQHLNNSDHQTSAETPNRPEIRESSDPESHLEQVGTRSEHQINSEHNNNCRYPSSSGQHPGSSDHPVHPVISADEVPHMAAKAKLLSPCGPSATTLTTLDPHHAPTDEESEGYINFLVRMYLGKDERQISTLKSEFTVYTADLQKAYSNHRANHGDGYGSANPYKGHNGQYEFSWYNPDGYHRGHHGGSSFSPLNVSARFEYPLSHHSEYMGSRHDRPPYYHHQ